METQEQPSVAELERRMRPGELSEGGFLGPTERLDEVLEQDRLTLRDLGISAETLASRLEELIDVAVGRPSHHARVGVFEVTVEVFTGFQICPWAPDIHAGQCTDGGGVNHGNVDWQITNTKSRFTMKGPGLIIHLIRAHAFFEGVGSPSRVDPGDLARLLGLSSPEESRLT